MRLCASIIALLAWLAYPGTEAADISSPYDSGVPFTASGKIDELQLANLQKTGIEPANICPDAVFLRRAFLDIIGTAPALEETKAFLSDTAVDKRAALINKLLERDEFALYWSLKWGDILRIKSEFPVNMWPNAVHAYSQWVLDAVRTNKPYDQFARELITASGSNFRDPPVNFYRSTREKNAAGLAKISALAFLGSRFQNWDSENQEQFQKLFSRVAYKGTAEWKEEIVFCNPEPVKAFTVKMPDGMVVKVAANTDPREAFADWLTGPAKKWFAQAAVNRAWFWLFGRGIVHEADDMALVMKGAAGGSNGGNPPANPELLDWLADEFIRSGYDFKALVRLLANSSTYQQSCIPRGDMEAAEKYFAVYKLRRMEAEVLADALSSFSNVRPKYMSVIPEPFTYIPEEHPTIALNDGSITSSFLENFGRAARDTGYLSERNNESTCNQRLFMLNSSEIQNQVCNARLMTRVIQAAKGDSGRVIDDIYLLVLARHPTAAEVETVLANYADIATDLGKEQKTRGKQGGGKKAGVKQGRFKNVNMAAKQLMWALVNSKEFLFKH